ncbi:TlyA family RNA methyltransferase [Ruminococcaceae bacterium OttesenSCG-928-A16]|nr:TlyA family RNA methyltransferase [Ruminococcaceae bacterium OttesenSCG-928-A16]
MKGIRLDQYLFDNGFTPSRERARAIIMAGIVYVNNEKADKAGTPVPEGATIEVRGKDLAYVSRGGLKLEKALADFSIALAGKVCMDIGASTGGFTDCMLQNGAKQVVAVDVGYGQLAWKLRCDERVVNKERTNIRSLNRENFPYEIDFFSVDVSFISLKHIFPVAAQICAPQAEGVCLVKPQFEAGRDKVGKKGVVREAETHQQVIEAAQQYAIAAGFTPVGLSFSPIKGPEGNIEFLLHVQNKGNLTALEAPQIADVVGQAHQQLAN